MQPVVEPVPGTGVVVVEAGQPANLQCRLVKGSPEPEITWRRARRPLPGGEESLSGSSITFPRASRHHTGLYTCSADNGWGEPATAQVGTAQSIHVSYSKNMICSAGSHVPELFISLNRIRLTFQ